MAPGAMLLRGFALPFVEDILRGTRRHRRAGAVPAHGDTMGRGDVGRDDQLRRVRMADRPRRLSLRPDRPGNRPAVAGHAWVLPGTGEKRGGSGRLPGLRARCLPDQPLCAGHPADAASGQGRARLCAPDRLRVAGSCRHLPVRRAKRRDPMRKFRSGTAMSSYGATSRGSPIMALPSSRTASTRFSARCVST